MAAMVAGTAKPSSGVVLSIEQKKPLISFENEVIGESMKEESSSGFSMRNANVERDLNTENSNDAIPDTVRPKPADRCEKSQNLPKIHPYKRCSSGNTAAVPHMNQ